MLVGQLPRTYRSLPRPNLMTPRHPPRALRSLTTPIGPPRPKLLPKAKAPQHDHPHDGLFRGRGMPQPGVSRRKSWIPTSLKSRSVRVLYSSCQLPVPRLPVSRKCSSRLATFHQPPATPLSTVLWRVPLTFTYLGNGPDQVLSAPLHAGV
jgi:hypothetical protein